MRCELIQPHLAAYIDGELDESLSAAVEKHLQECRSCREEVRDMRLASAVLSQWQAVEPSVSMIGEVRRRIAQEDAAPSRKAARPAEQMGRKRSEARPRRARTRRVVVAAAVLLGLGVAFLVWDWMRGPREPTPRETVVLIGRSAMKVKTIEDLRRAGYALDGVIADKWASPRPDADALMQLEVVATMMATASEPRQGTDVGKILNILGEERVVMGLREGIRMLAGGTGECLAALFALPAAAAQEVSAEMDSLLDEAIKLEEEGRLEEALVKYRRASSDRLLALRSFIHQANLEMRLGRADEAARTLRKAYRLTKPDTFNRDLVVELGRRADRAIELQGRIFELKAELLRTENEFVVMSEIGNLQVRAGNLKGAEETFGQIIRRFDEPRYVKDRLRTRLLRAWCRREMNQYTAASDEFNSLIGEAETVHPVVSTLAQHQRAKILHLRGRYAQAIDDYTDLASRPNVTAACHAALEFQVGYIYLNDLGNTAAAAETFRRLTAPEYRSQPFGRLAASLLAREGS